MWNELVRNELLTNPEDMDEQDSVPESTKRSTIQMKHIKAHLDVIAVIAIIAVSTFKIYDLMRRK